MLVPVLEGPGVPGLCVVVREANHHALCALAAFLQQGVYHNVVQRHHDAGGIRHAKSPICMPGKATRTSLTASAQAAGVDAAVEHWLVKPREQAYLKAGLCPRSGPHAWPPLPLLLLARKSWCS
jgi:hypothetical protein